MKHSKRLMSLLLTGAMLLGMLPVFSTGAKAASAEEVILGGTIGNSGFSATNLFRGFQNGLDGMTLTKNDYTEVNSDGEIDIGIENKSNYDYGRIKIGDTRASVTLTLRVSSSTVLSAIAAGGTAYYRVFGEVHTSDGNLNSAYYQRERGTVLIKENGTELVNEIAKEDDDSDDKSRVDYTTEWRKLKPGAVITVRVGCEFWWHGNKYDDKTLPNNEDHPWSRTYVGIEIKDETSPTLSSYQGSYNAAASGSDLSLKLGVKDSSSPDNYYYTQSEYNSDQTAKNSLNWFSYQFNFDKPVKPSNADELGDCYLFTNIAGTGFPNHGQPRHMVRQSSTSEYLNYLTYKYTANYGDYSGGNKISGNIGSLISKISAADYHDAAGNPLTGISTGKNTGGVPSAGYNVIVDAMPPTYSRVGNGITPDILTQMVLNENDTVDFIVSFSEAVNVKSGYTLANTYLMLDNGGRATYQSRSADGKQWVFRYTIPSGSAAEASQLKVIALTNTALDSYLISSKTGKESRSNDAAYTFSVDGRTLTDLTGNLMVERANEESPGTNTRQINSSTGWAGLSIDNNAPSIAFNYTVYGSGTLSKATDLAWGRAAKLFTSASDQDVAVAKYDPAYTSNNPTRASKGIYRPASTSGSEDQVGLIFYVWTRSATPPSAGVNYEAIKRYSLTGIQPEDVSGASYRSAWTSNENPGSYVGKLMMANNYADIVPPDAAMQSEGDGAWYLHVWTADMTWDSARQLTQYEKSKSYQYNSGYNNAKFLALKQAKVDGTASASSWADVSQADKEGVYNTAFTQQFRTWLSQSGSDVYSDAAMVYARSKLLQETANYSAWALSDFQKKDSNWTQNTARLLLDNTKPEAAEFLGHSLIGNGTAAVKLSFTISDAKSGVDTSKVYFQWVLKQDDGSQAPADVDWIGIDPEDSTAMQNALTDELTAPAYGASSATFTARTMGNVAEDGEYILYVKYRDLAGNETVADSGDLTVTVDSSRNVLFTFGPDDALSFWQRDVLPEVTVTGLTLHKLKYAVTNSIDRPESDDAFTEIAATPVGDKAYACVLPPLSGAAETDGTWYVHVLAYERSADQAVGFEDGGDGYFYRQTYDRQPFHLDRKGPTAYFSPNGFADPQDAIETVISFWDDLSGMAGSTKYRISTSSELFDADDEGWVALPAYGRISLSSTQDVTYYIHALAADLAGNVTNAVSEPFKLRGVKEKTVLPEYDCQLLATYTDEETGQRYGIANLTLDAADKAGYRYSVTTGDYWCNWLPFMSMIRLPLPETFVLGDLQVKFRAPDGTVSDPKLIGIPEELLVPEPEPEPETEPYIWATAEFDSTFRRQSVGEGHEYGSTLTLLMTHPAGVTVTPDEDDDPKATPEIDEESGEPTGNFVVTENGVYTFQISTEETDAASPLIVVVDLFDDDAPAAYLNFSEVAPTNGTVVVTVLADEPIRITSLKYQYANGNPTPDEDAYIETAPRTQFGFERNGWATFVVEDEAHNKKVVNATVTHIDRTPPSVKVVPNYDLYLKVGKGDDLIASGATLALTNGDVREGYDEKEPFDVVNNGNSATLEIEQNGTFEFIVQDKVGNVTTVEHEQTNIVKTLPDYEVKYTYDGTTDEVSADSPRQGKVLATVTFEPVTDGRKLYSGTVKVEEYRDVFEWDESTNGTKAQSHVKTVSKYYSNELDKNDDGQYVYSRTYSANGTTALVFCDDLGNVARIPVTIEGIDNTAPTLTLSRPTVVIDSGRTEKLSKLTTKEAIEAIFGSYTVADDCFKEDGITVTVKRSDGKDAINEVGRFTLVYTVTDGALNVSYAEQTLIVIPADGLLIEAGDAKGNSYALLSGSSTNNAILPSNKVTFRVNEERMQAMFFGNDGKLAGATKVQNEAMRYDIFYTSGLYREGQLKTIATHLTSEQLTSQQFKVTFPKPGWYTIIIRNQERTREYTTFFVASMSN